MLELHHSFWNVRISVMFEFPLHQNCAISVFMLCQYFFYVGIPFLQNSITLEFHYVITSITSQFYCISFFMSEFPLHWKFCYNSISITSEFHYAGIPLHINSVVLEVCYIRIPLGQNFKTSLHWNSVMVEFHCILISLLPLHWKSLMLEFNYISSPLHWNSITL